MNAATSTMPTTANTPKVNKAGGWRVAWLYRRKHAEKVLKLDYCAQTVAWFFKPSWSDDKITNYTQTVINDAQKYYPQQ